MANKTIGYSAVAGLAVLLTLGGTVVFDSFKEDVFYCEATNIAMRCDSLSAYYSLPNGKCNNAVIGNKLCRTGWIKIENDMVISPPQDEENVGGKWSCSPSGCIPL